MLRTIYRFLGLAALLCVFAVGCKQPLPTGGSDMGNGFFLVGSGRTPELHPADISIYFRDDARSALVWWSIPGKYGGPFRLEGGILFCAINRDGRGSIFVGNREGKVSEIMPFLGGPVDEKCELGYVEDQGEALKIKLWSGSEKLIELRIAKTELARIAGERLLVGVRTKAGKNTYFR